MSSDVGQSSDIRLSESTGEEPQPSDRIREPMSSGQDLNSYPLPHTVTLLEGPFGAKVYLVGTNHFSKKSQQDVSQTIRKVQPNAVVLELCESRLSILLCDEKSILEEYKTMGITKMRKFIERYGMIEGIMHILLLSVFMKKINQFGCAPGGEFRRAFLEAKRVPGCVVRLGDLPHDITVKKLSSSLNIWNAIQLLRDETFPKAFRKVILNERDTYLAYSLWKASFPIPNMNLSNGFSPRVVVGVVGNKHVPGIIKQWGKVSDKDIPPLFKISETSLTTKIIQKSVKYTFISVAVLGCLSTISATMGYFISIYA